MSMEENKKESCCKSGTCGNRPISKRMKQFILQDRIKENVEQQRALNKKLTDAVTNGQRTPLTREMTQGKMVKSNSNRHPDTKIIIP